jgi:N,N'-diacetyllegionaminate synthase
MKIEGHDINKKVLIIAEIGNNHEGSFTLAQEMLELAAKSGADAVKFQTFIPELYVANTETARLERLKRFQLSFKQFEALSIQAKELGIIFFSTPFDLESALFLNSIQQVFKISSGDNTFYPLIKQIAEFNKPMIISTGLAELNTINELYKFINDIWSENGINPGLSLLHCVSSYPVPPEQANIQAIQTLKNAYNDVVVGYSDHTMGNEASILAVATGARIIEKHFTIDKNYSDFRDHQLSADPAEFEQLVSSIRRTELFMGSGNKIAQSCEEDMKSPMRRSIASKIDISEGHILSFDDLSWVRPGIGLAPGTENQLLGRKLNRDIKRGEIIMISDLFPL